MAGATGDLQRTGVHLWAVSIVGGIIRVHAAFHLAIVTGPTPAKSRALIKSNSPVANYRPTWLGLCALMPVQWWGNDAGSMMGQRLRRCPIIEPASNWRPLLDLMRGEVDLCGYSGITRDLCRLSLRNHCPRDCLLWLSWYCEGFPQSIVAKFIFWNGECYEIAVPHFCNIMIGFRHHHGYWLCSVIFCNDTVALSVAWWQ